MSAVTMKYYSRYEISNEELEEMFQLFRKYYKNADLKTFRNDLDKKDGAYLIRRKSDNAIIGFSTLLEMTMRIGGKKVTGFFSGDTVLEKEYWGKTSLTTRYLLYFTKKRLLHPFRPLYWFLISKGYKTYLLMANNFLYHYPCHNRTNPRLAAIQEAYCKYLFGNYYDEKRRLLDFGDTYQALQDGVAGITPQMCAKYPKIAYFKNLNPTWDRGTELPCVGELSYTVIFYRFLKPILKGWSNLRLRVSRRRRAEYPIPLEGKN